MKHIEQPEGQGGHPAEVNILMAENTCERLTQYPQERRVTSLGQHEVTCVRGVATSVGLAMVGLLAEMLGSECQLAAKHITKDCSGDGRLARARAAHDHGGAAAARREASRGAPVLGSSYY